MRPGPASQTGRLLALLELGGWWTTRDLLKEVPSVVHSRISDLRAKGYTIEHKTTGEGAGGSLYRLVGFDALRAGQASEPSPALLGAPTGTTADARHDAGAPLAVPLPAEEGEGAAATSPSQLSLDVPQEHMYRRSAA